MNGSTESDLATARRAYMYLTLAYPPTFRKAYGPLMIQLFCDQYRAAHAVPGHWALERFWLRTLGDLVSSVVREQALQFRSVTMNQERVSTVILGVLLFVLMGTAVGLAEAPVLPDVYSLVNMAGMLLMFCGYLMVLGLLLKGWLAGFPRWIYPYLSYAIIFPLYLSSASTPGLELFGLPLWGKEMWGWRAFVPLELIAMLALIFSRPPWGNLLRLVRNIWEDWTLAAFCLFGLMPLVVFFSLDEVEHSFSFWPQITGALLISLGAFLYMRLVRPGLRFLALLASSFFAVAVMSGSADYYWQTHDVNMTTGVIYQLTATVNWSALLLKAITEAGFVALFLLIPLPLALVRMLVTEQPGHAEL